MERQASAEVATIAATTDEIRQAIRVFLAELLELNVEAIDAGVSLLRLGVQSLHFIVLTSYLEKRYQIEIPGEYAIPDDHTIETYVAVVEQELSRGTREQGDTA